MVKYSFSNQDTAGLSVSQLFTTEKSMIPGTRILIMFIFLTPVGDKWVLSQPNIRQVAHYNK